MSNGWPEAKLGSVLRLDTNRVDVTAGTTYEMAGVYSFGRGLFRKEWLDGANTSYKFFYRLDADHIVMSQLFGWEGALALSSDDYAGRFVSPQFPTFRCVGEQLDRQFLGWYIRRPAFWEDLGKRTKGMGDRRRTLNPDALFQCLVPLPPLPEQQRIVAKIEEVATKIEEVRGLRQTADVHSAALALSAGSQFFVVNGALQTEVRLDSLTERITKGESPSWQGFSYQEAGPLFIRSENVLWGKLDVSSCNHISHEFHTKLSRSQLRENDVLVNLVGASIGRACIVPSGIGQANVNQAVGVVTPRSLLNSSYLVRFLLSVPGQELIHGGKVETARANISLRDVASLKVPVPPLPEQRRIVAYLDELQVKVDCVKALQAQTQAELDALLPSILDKAFKGEL